jgi:eukaryotic-like serine/threonine-protein kinase
VSYESSDDLSEGGSKWQNAASLPPFSGSQEDMALSSLSTGPSSLNQGQIIGDYELLEQLGQGGMGIVYRARHRKLNRMVALKMVSAGRLASEVDLRRFRIEAESAALLDHRGIVPIYEVGDHKGWPFYTMRLIHGESLARQIPRFSQHPKVVVRLMIEIARAVQHAHDRGILHRDLKPANILIDGHSNPLITDFGLAKRLSDGDNLTLTGMFLGTPNYMAPEQARGRKTQITVAVDVFSLGAILYHLLTETPPFEGETTLDILQKVIEKEPGRPSLKNRSVDHDLETICLKCLEKVPHRRYVSAAELASDLERWLNHEPIHARAISRTERSFKWVKRNPIIAIPVGILWIGVVVIIAQSWIANKHLRRERDFALIQEERARAAQYNAEHQQYASQIKAISYKLDTGKATGVLDMLEACNPDLRSWEWGFLRGKIQAPAWKRRLHLGSINAMTLSTDGQLLVTAGEDRMIRAWDRHRHQPQWHYWFHEPTIGLAIDSRSSTVFVCTTNSLLRINSLEGRIISRREIKDVNAFCYHSESRCCVWATKEDGLVGSSAETGQVLFRWPAGEEPTTVLTSAGTFLAAGDESGQVRLFQVSLDKSLRLLHTINFPYRRLHSMVLDLDRQEITVSCWRYLFISSFTNTSRKSFEPFAEHDQQIRRLVRNNENNVLLSSGQDGVVKIHSMPDHRLQQTLYLDSDVTGLVVASDGAIVTADALGYSTEWHQGGDGFISVNELKHKQLHTGNGVSFSPKGDLLAVKGWGYEGVVLWNTASWMSRDVPLPQCLDWTGIFHPDNGELITLYSNKIQLSQYSSDKWIPIKEIPTRKKPRLAWIDRQGKYLLSNYAQGGFDIWNIHTGQRKLHPFLDKASFYGVCALNSSGTLFAIIASYRPLLIVSSVEPQTGETFELPTDHNLAVDLAVAFHPTQPVLAASGSDNGIALWDLRNRQRLRVLRGHLATVASLEFSPDGKRLVSGSMDHTVRVWDWEIGEELLLLRNKNYAALQASFSPDGRLLASTDSANLGRVYFAKPWLTPGLDDSVRAGEKKDQFLFEHAKKRLSAIWLIEAGNENMEKFQWRDASESYHQAQTILNKELVGFHPTLVELDKRIRQAKTNEIYHPIK